MWEKTKLLFFPTSAHAVFALLLLLFCCYFALGANTKIPVHCKVPTERRASCHAILPAYLSHSPFPLPFYTAIAKILPSQKQATEPNNQSSCQPAEKQTYLKVFFLLALS